MVNSFAFLVKLNQYQHTYIHLRTHAHVHRTVQFCRSVMSYSLRPHGLQHARLPCPSPTPGACSNSCPSSRWYHPTISHCRPLLLPPSIFPSIRVFSKEFFATGGQSIGVSASVLPMSIQDWYPLGFTGLISLQSKGLSRVFSSTIVQKHSSVLCFLYSPTLTSIHDYWKNHSFD